MADTNLLVLAREYKKLREEVKKVLSMPKGDKGDPGEKGEKGDKGDTGPQGFPGRDGKDGVNGFNGQDGRDGVDGKDGKDGLDGVGVSNAYIDFDNSLVIVLSNGTEINAGFLSQEAKENVVATFKQGAQTLNELLPIQTGNAGKFLKTDGTDVSWDTLDGSDIDLASPPVIGNTTPNAATFTTLTATGQTSLGGVTDSESLRVLSPSVTGTYIQATGGSTQAEFRAVGSQNNNSLFFVSRGGSGVIGFSTNNSVSNIQFRVGNTASAVNYVQVTGAATNNIPFISAQGSDASVALGLTAKSGSSVNFFTNNGTNRGLRIGHVANSVNYFNMGGSAAGSAPVLSVDGTDTNIDLALTPKGTGNVRFGTYTGTALTIAGYIEIKDSGGTVRKLAVVA